ncbi:MAG: phenylacetate--CoA ligase [Clostridia bacterium]|nr:phenylacetate--CoA ligase [Clostridia bacterium]
MIWNRAMETLPREELKELQLRRLKEVVARVAARVPFYRRRFAEVGVAPDDIRSLEDLPRLPFTRKSDLRDHYPYGLLAVPREECVRLHASSGTRGKPTVVAYTRQDVATWAEVIARSIGCAGGRPGDVLHNAYGYGLFTGGLGLHYGAELMGQTVVPASGGFTQRQVELIVDLGANGLCCTPSYALQIAETMREMGVDPEKLALRYGIFGAEPWTEAMRRQIESELHLDAVDIYGLSEIIGPGVACECAEAKAGAHIFEDHFLPEVVDPETGEVLPPGATGELVLTTLTKEAMPLIRYRTGDISSLAYEPCRCGRTTVRMTRIVGRSDDMLIIRGVNVFPSEVEDVLVSAPELSGHYRIVLTREGPLDRMTVEVEANDTFVRRLAPPGEPLPSDHPALREVTERVRKQLVERLRVSAELRVLPPRSIPRPQGKAVRVLDQRGGVSSAGR